MPRSAAPVRLAQLVLALLLGLVAAAPAVAADPPVKQKGKKKAPETMLGAAREESNVNDRPPARHGLPAGELRLSSSELLAGFGQSLELTATLDRDVDSGRLEVTLPERWLARSGVSGLPYAKVPQGKRAGRTVAFDFAGAKAGDAQSFSLKDVGIPAGTYELPYRWKGAGGNAKGTAKVIFYAPARETTAPAKTWGKLPSPGFEKNVTDDGTTESETFLTVVPGNKSRFVAGANGGSTDYNAWITNDGGQTFTEAAMPTTTDVAGEAAPETSRLCCDPMSAADSAGNIWYGGLSQENGAGEPSRIVVGRFAPGATQFQPQIVGLQQRTSGTQDKPMMTIDNSPTSPKFGMLYVIWNEPTGGGINVVISQCDTRPVGNTLNAANCDNADNWTAPVSVTPATGGYIYADVATGPDGKVYAVWWDYSATNAIRGDVCDPATQNCAAATGWGTPQTIATLDATGGSPIPFACPIVAQPGGRASTSPQVEVDSSNGPHRGRVYVTWSDLRAGSGTTKCEENTPPTTSQLSFDSFVASKPGGVLPGSAASSPSVATRLFTDGATASDDWFPWLAVDQTTGEAWADFYSTRHDATRQTTHFYVRKVTPTSTTATSHTLGALTQVSTEASDYSDEACCNFGNQYGDYTGIDATSGVAIPIWSDNRASDVDGEAFTYVGANPALVADGFTVNDAAGGDGDGKIEPGESFNLTQKLKNAGAAAATGINASLTESMSTLSLTQASSTYPDAAPGAVVSNATPFGATLAPTARCGDPLTLSMSLRTAQGPFTVPITLPTGTPGAAATSTASPGMPIPDDDGETSATSTINLTGTGNVTDMNVQVNITHPWVGDLDIELTGPDGTTILLVAGEVFDDGDNFTNTVFDDEAATAISAGSAPYTGSFRPEEALSAFDGKPVAGAWTLTVTDWASPDSGTLNSWGLTRPGTPTCSPPPAASQRADFNGDGFSDLAAGAPGENVGTLADAGAVNVSYGSSTGLKTTGSVAFTANSANVVGTSNAGDKFGTAVATGNFNGDRFSDLAIGAPGDEAGTVTDAGSVTVLYGSATGLTGTGSEIFTQPVATGTPTDANAEASDGFGSSLAVGNIGKSTSSFADIAVGIPGENVGTLADAGAVQVLYAATTGGISTTGTQFVTQTSLGANPSEAGDKFGSSLASANFDGAGQDDLAIGVPFQNAATIADAGAVHIAKGGSTGLSTTTDVVVTQASTGVPGDNAANDQFGSALAAGDFSGGANAEVAVGVPGKKVGTIVGAGQVIVLPSGAATGAYAIDQNTADVEDAAETGDRFGSALAIADFGGTSKGDLAVGAPNESVGTVAQAGQVHVLDGSTSAIPAASTLDKVFNQGTSTTGLTDTAETNDHFGSSLTVGQFGSGAKLDLFVGIPHEDAGATADAGAVQMVLAGASAGLATTGNKLYTQGAAPQLGDTVEASDFLGTALG